MKKAMRITGHQSEILKFLYAKYKKGLIPNYVFESLDGRSTKTLVEKEILVLGRIDGIHRDFFWIASSFNLETMKFEE